MTQINIADINRDEFEVKQRDGRFLINPSKAKHVWKDEELHLRSLLTDAEGNVLSSGFPKFVNYGEIKEHDEAFLAALTRNEVEFTEKMDGSLVILDVIDGKAHLRTRGNFDLGDFDAPVRAVIAEKFPNLISWIESGPFFFDDCSILFEYVAPTNRIVIRYDEPDLFLLGVVDKNTLTLYSDDLTLGVLAKNTGVPAAPKRVLPTDFQTLAPIVRAWTDVEGVVASFKDGLMRPRLLKIKATQYVKLHAIKFKLEGKVSKLAFLLGITSKDEARQKLFDMGIDYEAQSYIEAELDQYLDALTKVRSRWTWFVGALENTKANAVGSNDDLREARKQYVTLVREWLQLPSGPFDMNWFSAAMHIYDGRRDDAYIDLIAKVVFKDSVNVLKNWIGNEQTEIDAMLTTPGGDD